MTYEGWIGFRYLTAKKEPFLAVINFVAVMGVAIGVGALIIVIAVMAGFDHDLKEKIIGTSAHIVVERENGIKDFAGVGATISAIDGVGAVAPFVQGPLFLEYDGQARGVMGRGVDPTLEGRVTKVEDYLVKGKISDLSEKAIIIGSELADYLGKGIGDTVTLVSPSSGLSKGEWRYELTVTGIFTSGMYDYDMNLIIMNLKKAQEIFSLGPGRVTGLAVKLHNVYDAPKLKKEIYQGLGYSFLVKTWIDTNRNFFAALKLEKFAMFVILTLIVLVASFNIVSTLIVTVTTKIKDIGVLRAIGVPQKAIRRIFIMKGVAIGIIGTFWGLAGGIGISLLLKKYQFIKLPADIYYIDRMPILLQLSDLLIITASALVISYAATIYPANKAAQLEPVEALRYE